MTRLVVPELEPRDPARAEPLLPGEVQLWYADLDSVPGDEGILSAAESARAERVVDADAKARFVRSRTLVRRLLGAWLGLPAGEIALESTGEGKPRVVAPPHAIDFNLSHTGSAWALAASISFHVGVDLERIRPRRPDHDVARRIFTSAECAWLADLPEARRTPAFFTIWTIREAVTKLRGEGIFTLSASFEVVPQTDGRLEARVEPPEELVVDTIPAPVGHVGALAVSASPRAIRAFRVRPDAEA
ncbi:MAG: 4'-phosphopantetheinyl transferase superfamily protein [Gemmatimonadetes bacterium]|nr:4'-phosphopantetheinyl transferase superfamily protein [Gemmatimonadota bacterium]